MLIINLNKWLWIEMWNFHFGKTSENKVVNVCFYEELKWSISWPRRNIWYVAFSHNINFYNSAIFFTYYYLYSFWYTFTLCFYGNRKKLPLSASYTPLLQKKRWSMGITIEVLSSWKCNSKSSCKCSWLQFQT